MAEQPFGVDKCTVKCTEYCGFSVTGTQMFCQSTFERHKHRSEEDEYESSWYHSVFSLWGVLALLIIAGVVVSISTGKSVF